MAEGCEEELGLREDFAAATTFVRGLTSRLTESDLLAFYGLYKQATEGPCTKPKPSWYQMTEKHKWEAWNAVRDLDPVSAMRKYVQHLTTVDPAWQTKEADTQPQSWVTHSCLANNEAAIPDASKTVCDWVKENNVERVRRVLQGRIVDVNALDEDGLALLHWAADRGSLPMVKLLLDHCADVNVRDGEGQTALHFAASCGHQDVLAFLLGKGADRSIEDHDQQTPLSVASNKQIEDVLNQFI